MIQNHIWDFYIAGPLFTRAEQNYNQDLYYKLRSVGFKVFLPQDHVRDPNDGREIFQTNVKNLRLSKGLIVICDGADMDSGTAWEAGHFYTHGQIYGLRTDLRKSADDPVNGFNLMISQSASHTFGDHVFMVKWLNTQIAKIGE